MTECWSNEHEDGDAIVAERLERNIKGSEISYKRKRSPGNRFSSSSDGAAEGDEIDSDGGASDDGGWKKSKPVETSHAPKPKLH